MSRLRLSRRCLGEQQPSTDAMRRAMGSAGKLSWGTRLYAASHLSVQFTLVGMARRMPCFAQFTALPRVLLFRT